MRNRGPGRCVVTGIGVVSPVGIGKETFIASLCEGRSGIGRLSLFPTDGLCSRLAGEVRDFEPQAVLGARGPRLLDRTSRLALTAGALALRDAGLDSDAGGDDFGIALGSNSGSLTSRCDFYRGALEGGFRSDTRRSSRTP